MEHQFLRNEMLWGREGQRRLAHAHVLLLGLGGVGSYAAERLTPVMCSLLNETEGLVC